MPKFEYSSFFSEDLLKRARKEFADTTESINIATDALKAFAKIAKEDIKIIDNTTLKGTKELQELQTKLNYAYKEQQKLLKDKADAEKRLNDLEKQKIALDKQYYKLEQDKLKTDELYIKNQIQKDKLAEQNIKKLTAQNKLIDQEEKILKRLIAEEERENKTKQKTIELAKKEEENKKKLLELQKQRNAIQEQKQVEQEIRNQIQKDRLAEQEIKKEITKNRLAEQQDKIKKRVISDSEKENKAKQKALELAQRESSAFAKIAKARNEAQKQLKESIALYGEQSKRTQVALRNFNRLDDSYARINKLAKDGRPDVGRYTLATEGLGKSFLGLGKSLIGAFGVIGGIQLFASAVRESFNIVKNFSSAQSELVAILGKTKSQIKDLEAVILQLGESTSFTATEVTNAATELAKLGFNTNEIKASLKGVLDGAVAMGVSIADSASLSAKTLRAFGLEANETDRIVSTLAVSTTKSALNFEYLNDSLPYASTTARQLGQSVEYTTAQLGVLADNGIKASTAGTSLRDIFSDLAKKGMTLNQALDVIAKSTDKTKTATDLFGKTSASSAIILSQSRQKVDELTRSITNQKEALDRLVETRLDNLEGDVKLLTSAWEGFVLSIEKGDGALATFSRGFVQFLTKTLSGIDAIAVKLELFTKGLEDLSESGFKSLIRSGELESGLGIAKAFKKEQVDLETVLKEVNNLQKAYGNDSEKYIRGYLDTVKKYVSETLKANGESAEDTAIITKRYLKLIREEIESNNKLKEESQIIDESDIEITENKEKITRALTGAIEKQAKVVGDLRTQIEQADESAIAGLNQKLILEEKELDRLRKLGIEFKTLKSSELEYYQSIIRIQEDFLSTKLVNEKEYSDALRDLELKRLEDSLSKENNPEEQAKIQKQINDILIEIQKEHDKEIQDLVSLDIENSKKKREEEEEAEKARLDRIAQYQKDAFEFLSDLDDSLTDKRLANIDKQIEASKKEQDRLKEVANQKSVDTSKEIADQDRKQAELEQKRQKEERAKLTRQFIEIYGSTLVNAINNNSPNPQADAVKAVFESKAFIKAFTTFKKGSDFVGKDGSKKVFNEPNDNYLARVDYGEMIFDADEAKELRRNGFDSRAKVLNHVKMSTLEPTQKVLLKSVPVESSSFNREVIEVLKELPYKMPINKESYIPILHAIKGEEKIDKTRTIRLRKINKGL